MIPPRRRPINFIGPRKQRVNYRYLTRLSDRLDNLGHNIHEIPADMLLECNWNVHREYIQSEWHLAYCIRCKLPCADGDMDPTFANMCKEHADMFRIVIEDRQSRIVERRMSRVSGGVAHIVAVAEQRDRTNKDHASISRLSYKPERGLDIDAFMRKARGDK
jgi:hypothetical protein